MKTLKISALLALLLLGVTCKKNDTSAADGTTATESKISKQRIVTLNGGITEIVSALGHEKEIVGIDVTSTYPESLKTTAKDLGHVRSMTIEPVMELGPTLILATNKDLNSDLLKKIQESGIKTDVLSQEYTVEGTKRLIEQVAKALGNNDYQHLNNKIDADLAQVKPLASKPKVLFIYARGNNLMVGGKGTPMVSLIGLAGGENAVNDFEDFKPLTPEALVQYNPDVLLFFTSGLESAGGVEGVLKTPGISQTNAGKNKKIIAMDGGLISSFGPRLGEATRTLNQLLVEHSK